MLGILAGSLISVFLSSKISLAAGKLRGKRYAFAAVIPAAFLGAASPICMYGTVPLIASLGRKGVPQHLIAAFMISSILINPNLFIITFSLGVPIALMRLFLCVFAGILAGWLVKLFFKNKPIFDFNSFEDRKKSSSDARTIIVLLKDMHRAVVKTTPYFLLGIVLTALFEHYIPKLWIMNLFGYERGFGVLMATSLGVPLYVCGGGTVPLIKEWMRMGMSLGSAMAFMITGPATKITNIFAVKTILGFRNFILYFAYNILFAIITGYVTDFVKMHGMG